MAERRSPHLPDQTTPSEPAVSPAETDPWRQGLKTIAELQALPEVAAWPAPTPEQRARAEAAMAAYEQFLSDHGLLPAP